MTDDMNYTQSMFDWDALGVKVGATADPAAGSEPAEITFAKRTLFLGGLNVIVADATVINRLAHLDIKTDGTTVDREYYGPAMITASQTIRTNIGLGATAVRLAGSNHDLGLNMPGGVELPAGAKIRIRYSSIQAGDDAGIFYYVYKEAP